MAPHHITVNTIAPYTTRTGLGRHMPNYEEVLALRAKTIPLGRVLDPGDLVGTAVFLASGASDFITGQTIVVDGGFRSSSSCATSPTFCGSIPTT